VHPEQILAEADRCVKCGYCLPHCPTYARFRDEGESPRGRIALIQGAVEGVVAGGRLHVHLDRCLACRACEPACPSGVRYGQLIAAARALLREEEPTARKLTSRLELSLLSRLPYLRITGHLTHLYERSGLRRLIRNIGGSGLKRRHDLLPLPERPARWREHYPPPGEPLGRVGLFTGCVSRLADQRALLATVELLNRLGVEVVVPKTQACCGAMALDAGETHEAERLAEINRRAFAQAGVEAVVTVASGCGSHLAEYGERGPRMPCEVQDVSTYLAGLPQLSRLRLRPLNKRVAVHTPCSLKNILGAADGPLQLLRHIPGIDLFPLPENGLCCGAAGRYLLSQPEIADALREDKLAALEKSRPEILVTSNTGCALHLAAGIREAGLQIEVRHPVELLARQLD
jgi:glycolate oxidase iron-sulfur subunit